MCSKKGAQAHLKNFYPENVFRNHIFNIYVIKGFGIK